MKNGTHRLKLASGILDKDLTHQDTNIDWPHSQMKTVIHYARNGYQEFDGFQDQVDQKSRSLEKITQREIESKSQPSGNLLANMVRGNVRSSNSTVSPVKFKKYDGKWHVHSVLSRGDYNSVQLKVKRGGSINADGYAKFRIRLKINEISEDKEIVNQIANIKLEFKYQGKSVYITRTPDVKTGEILVDVPRDLGRFDKINLILENAMATIRSIDFEIESVEFLPGGRAELRERAGIMNIDKPSHKIENLKGRFTVFIDLADIEELTDEQFTEDYEKTALRHKNVSFVFYNTETEIDSGKRERLEKLQGQLGLQRIEITNASVTELLARQWFGKLIHVSKGKPTVDLNLIQATALKKNIVLFRYIENEIGVVPTALLFANEDIKGFEGQMIDLSMVSERLRSEVRQYLASLVIARAA